jgi:hypothetical protein
MRLVSGGVLLQDDQLMEEVIDDDDDDDGCGRRRTRISTITLDMVPPVDPKFATRFHTMQDISTSDLLDAYAANAAAMYHKPSSEEATLKTVQLRQEAHDIRQQLLNSFPEKVAALVSEEPPSASVVEDRRGQRYRTTKGGARTNLRRIIQTNLNIVRTDVWLCAFAKPNKQEILSRAQLKVRGVHASL